MQRWPAPSPSPIFVGRDEPLARLSASLKQVPVALVYGVAGVGKSALAYAAAARSGSGVVHRRAHGEPLGVLVDDVRRQLAQGTVPEIAADEDRLADLAVRLDAEPCLWVLDDLHALAPAERVQLLGALAGSLRRGRVVATSRERVARKPGDPDRLELTIEGLDEASARSLWRSLDELYGPAAGFDEAARRCKGNPFQLRRAHAGGLDDDDPIAAAVAGLGPDERRVAGALALAEWRLPLEPLAALLPEGRARAAVRRLVTVFVADVDGAGTVGVHGLFREAIRAALDPALARELHGELARIYPGAGLDRVVRVREVVRHLGAAGRHVDAGKYLVDQAVELVKIGAAAELLRGLESIPEAVRTDEVKLARARCLPRLLELSRGCDELARLVAARAEPLHEVKLAFGAAMLAAGRLGPGLLALREVLDDPSVSRGVRVQVLMQYGWGLAHAGRGDEARRLCEEAEARSDDEQERGLLAFVRATTLWHEERDAEADEPMRRARALLPDRAPPYTAGVLVPLALAAMLARLGRVDEAEELARSAEAVAAGHEDLQSQVYVKRMRAAVLYERGERVEALALLRWVSQAYERGGGLTGQLLCDVQVGRIFLETGKRAEGKRLLDATAERARAVGHGSIVLAVERSRRHDPVTALAAPPDALEAAAVRAGAAPPKRGETCRARAIAALRAGARGDGATARALVLANERDAAGPGYAVERALGHLALATLARVEGQNALAAAAAARAAAAAAEGAVDPDLVSAVQERLGALRLVTPEAARSAPAATPDLARHAVVLDGRSHELCVRRKVISLKRSPALRKLLYALASHPNDVLSKEALARCLWTARYNPLTHDNALWVNLRRLRVLLEKTGLQVDLADEGYRLTVPADFLYIDPSA